MIKNRVHIFLMTDISITYVCHDHDELNTYGGSTVH